MIEEFDINSYAPEREHEPKPATLNIWRLHTFGVLFDGSYDHIAGMISEDV